MKSIFEEITLIFPEQNFGVDLEARARVDRKRVPILVTTILTYLDNRKILICPSGKIEANKSP
jgi:hypothetical protein